MLYKLDRQLIDVEKIDIIRKDKRIDQDNKDNNREIDALKYRFDNKQSSHKEAIVKIKEDNWQTRKEIYIRQKLSK